MASLRISRLSGGQSMSVKVNMPAKSNPRSPDDEEKGTHNEEITVLEKVCRE